MLCCTFRAHGVHNISVYSGCARPCAHSCCLTVNPRRAPVLERQRKGEGSAQQRGESEFLLPTIPHVAQLPFKHHKQASGVMSRSEGREGGATVEGVGEDGGLPGLRAKAEHKHNSNRNQLEPSKLFMRQMDTFPRDFTLKHGSVPPPPPPPILPYPRPSPRPPSTGSAPHTRRWFRTVITITLSKPFHV